MVWYYSIYIHFYPGNLVTQHKYKVVIQSLRIPYFLFAML